jgi:hypothetical protein
VEHLRERGGERSDHAAPVGEEDMLAGPGQQGETFPHLGWSHLVAEGDD